MSIELDDNVNTSVTYINESSTSVEQDHFEEMKREAKVERTVEKGIDWHVGELKIQGIEMKMPGSLKQKNNIRQLIDNPIKGPIHSSSALVAKLIPKPRPIPILDPKVQLKIIGVPTKISNTPILKILVNNTGQNLVGEFTKDDIKKGDDGDDVDYTQLEGALQGYPLNSKQRDALRKSWRSACDKRAAKSCTKACTKSAVNVEGPKDFKKILKKECKRSCKTLFNVQHKDSDSDSDSDSESDSRCNSDSD